MRAGPLERAEADPFEDLATRFPGKFEPVRPPGSEPYAAVAREHLRPILARLRDESGFEFLLDLTAVDRAGLEPRAAEWRFSVVYHLGRIRGGRRFRVAARVPRREPLLPSVSDLWASARWAEREVAELFGIRFESHPDPRRLFLPDDCPGAPLRKDHRPAAAPPETLAREAARAGALDPEGGGAGLVPLEGARPAAGLFGDPGAPRVRVRLSAKRIAASDVEVGFGHSGFEKLAEALSYRQGLVAAARLSAEGAFERCLGWALAIERILGLEPPPRATVLRTILSEVSRIASHLRAVSRGLFEAGLPFEGARLADRVAALREEVSDAAPGGDPAASVRIGGFSADASPEFPSRLRAFAAAALEAAGAIDREFARSRLLKRRLRGAGAVGPREAVRLGLSGPALRASGVAYDVRRAAPYGDYGRYEFEVPTQAEGDARARHLQRIEEARASAGILEQALEALRGLAPPAPVALEDKARIRESCAALIRHVKLAIDGGSARPERGAEVFSSTEAPAGELAFYVVSDGSPRPYRLHLRSPSFYHAAAIPALIAGATEDEARAAVASLGLIPGEIDR